jgi:hypothetical protein
MSNVPSVRADLAVWCVDRLKSEVSYLRECFALGRTEEFKEIVMNPPSACVIMTKSSNSQVPTPPGEVYAYFTVEIWFTADRFRADETEEGLTTDRGIYEIYDDIHAAFSLEDDNGRIIPPTGCDEPMEFMEGEVTDLEEGHVTAYAEYQTARLI